ncbi:MAG: ATP-binding protein [Succinivibrionaceae bacterium]
MANTDQIKLSTLSVYNWGSFQGLHTISINENGTLITGENGAGKSTIIDGLMVLLRPAGNAGFNMAAAQGDKSDRSIVSYMRGSYGRALSEEEGQVSRNLRIGSVVSVIKAVYCHTESDHKVVLIGIFSITGQGMSVADVKRIYIVGETDISIKDILSHFSNHDIRHLKSWLKQYDDVRVCDNNFSEYFTHFTHKLHMDNQNAPALLSRALGLKKIDDLTTLIRTLVLEPGEIKQDAEAAVNQFSDLRITHEKLMDARARMECLLPLRQLNSDYSKNIAEAELFKDAISSFEGYAAGIAVKELSANCKEYNKQLEQLIAKERELEIKKQDTEHYIELCHENYLKNGGDVLESFENEIRQKEIEYQKVERIRSDYVELVQAAGMEVPKTSEDFQKNLDYCSVMEIKISDSIEGNSGRIGRLEAEQEDKVKELNSIKDEITDLEKHPDSNIDIRFQKLRNEISKSLSIDRSKLVYAAELIEVRSEEESWHGAIERALGGIRQTLIVAPNDYRNITAWLNARNTGLHVRVQVAGRVDGNQEFGNRGFLRKLYWKEHEFTAWLKSFLLKHDLTCVDSVNELNDTEFSMTREGLIHKKGLAFEKKDLTRIDDRHDWCTGFSIKERLSLLQEDYSKLEKQLLDIAKKIKNLRETKQQLENQRRALNRIENYKYFSDIDTISIKEKIDEIRASAEKIRTSDDTKKLRELWEEAKKTRALVDKELFSIAGKKISVSEALKSTEVKLSHFRDLENNDIEKKVLDLILKICKEIQASCHKPIYDSDFGKKVGDRFNYRLKSKEDSINDIINKVTNIFIKFSTKWETITADWGSDFLALPNYMNHLDNIEREGLPALVEEFKEKLTNEVTQSVACIDQKMKSELNAIRERIGKINQVLEKTEFRENTFLCIKDTRPKFIYIDEFSRNTSKVLNMISSDDHEKRYSAISKVIETLESALKSSSIDSKRLLDPRLQVQFTAQELDRETKEIKDVLDSSSGKSGGEKEAFAGTVVAASLAYVLTPENGECPVYSTVFLDEAFSNTSDAVSVRVLKIFKELRLHVNLITPFKNIDVARDYARSLIIMSRDINTHSSSISELTWDEYDAQIEEGRATELQSLGITIDNGGEG